MGRRSTSKIASQRALAKALNISSTSAHQAVNHADWKFGRGPWSAEQIEQIRAWHDALPGRQQQTGAGSTQKRQIDLTEARKLKTIEDIKTGQLKRRILEGLYHSVDECRRRRMLAIHHCKDELLAMPAGLPVDDSIKDLIHQRLEHILAGFAREYVPPDEVREK